MRLPLWLHSDDGRTVTLARCRNCGKTKATSDPCGFDHAAALMEFGETARNQGWLPPRNTPGADA